MKELGHGAQGRVSLVEREGLQAAFKSLPPAVTPAQKERFRGEIELLSRLSHPNLVRFLAFVDDPKEGPGYAMEVAEGVPLGEAFAEAGVGSALGLLVQACRGLHHLHARGFVHGDLKPEHLVVENAADGAAARLKIIDFGLARAAGESSPAGTAAYLAPEGFWGAYDAQSDLFSLGVVFYEALAGRLPFSKPLTRVTHGAAAAPLLSLRKDVPQALAAAIDWLVKPRAADRPRSALSVIRYLNQHVAKPFALDDEEALGAVLQKVPWVSRPEEDAFLSASAGRVVVEGPTGAGRSRFLSEMTLKLQLAGQACVVEVPAPDVAPRYIFLGDLERRDPAALEQLHLSLRSVARRAPGTVFVLERNTDRASPAMERLFQDDALGPLTTIRLKDFDDARARSLLESATQDLAKPLAKNTVEALVRSSGGRPLLILEELRSALGAGVRGGGYVPGSWRAAVAARVASLSNATRSLLAAVVAHPEPLSLEGVAGFSEAMLELQSADVAAWSSEGFALRHETLRAAYAAALPEPERRAAHAEWLRRLIATEGKQPQATPKAALIVHHALGAGEREIAQVWKRPAFDALLAQGRLEALLNMADGTLAVARNAEDRYTIQAYRAAALYRLGRFQETRAAYEAWFRDRDDDGTGLIPMRFSLQLGQTALASGDLAEARRLLELATSSKKAPAPHHPFLARAWLLLAAIAEREGRWKDALTALASARRFAGEEALLQAEIEQRESSIASENLKPEDALAHARSFRDHARAAKSAQAEALALGQEAMIQRDLCDPEEAEKVLKLAFARAEEGGERLQKARLRENLALLRLDRGDYGAAARGFDEAGDALELFGSDDDRAVLAVHRLTLASLTGRRLLFARERARLLVKPSERARAEAYLALAEHEYRLGRFASAEKGFAAAGALFGKAESPRGCAAARLGVFRCRVRAGAEAATEGDWPAFGAWKAWGELRDLAVRPALDAAAVKSFLAAAKDVPFPETRSDLLRCLAAIAEKRNVPKVLDFCRKAAERETAALRERLPEEMIMDFDQRDGFEGLEDAWDKPAPKAQSAPRSEGRTIPENRFRQFCEISRQIATRQNFKEVVERVMDAAIELTGAERGFLLVANGKGAGPVPGFDIPVARHLNQRSLGKDEFQLSLTVVREAIEKGSYVLTDDAQSDPRFSGKASVAHFQLKSILAVPLEIEGKILGAVYLDHKLRADCFREEDIVLVNAFASQAAIAIQKIRAAEALEADKGKLEVRVKDLTGQIEGLTKGFAQKRSELKYGYDEIVGRSPAMMKVFHLLDRVTDANVPVWILGESGTGKELVARSLHENSPRKKQPYVSENVSAISETLLESELFGHKKGSFTHADRDRIGLFEQANGGTLFLDEVADMSLAMQAKLLRVLQEKEIRPVGSTKKVKIDVRLVTASNKDLRQMVKAGTFRQDLLFRINGMTVALPPLRERRDDIPILAKHFLGRVSKELGMPAGTLTPEALQALIKHEWPGNVRELEAVIRNALLFANGGEITPDVIAFQPAAEPEPSVVIPGSLQTYKRGPADAGEREVLLNALKKHHLDKVEAAKDLGICLKTFYNKLEKHEIPKKRSALLGMLGLKG